MATLNPEQVLLALRKGRIDLHGQFLNGSNYTFLCTLKHEGSQFSVVYKPTRGETPLWDFPAATLAKREAAAYLVSEALGWQFVPPTVYRSRGPFGRGSAQLFMDHDPENHFFNLKPEDRQRLRQVVLFDLLINNADRKGGHILIDRQGMLWLIDHGVCFHVDDKLRTVVWDFAGEPIPADLLADVSRLADELAAQQGAYDSLKPLLRKSEINAMIKRARLLVEKPVFPQPDPHRRPYPWPPV
jgi:uncharacterized repeat protein (TIGR03843 family)